MKYDPIMCMMVPDTVKTKDGYKIVETLEKKRNYGLYVIETEHGKRIVLTFPGETVNNPHMWLGSPTPDKVSSARNLFKSFVKDSNTLDKAIRSCDEQIRLVKTISKKNGYAIHIVEGGYGERVVLTFPNESYANPHMWLGSNNSSNIQKAKELLDKFSK